MRARVKALKKQVTILQFSVYVHIGVTIILVWFSFTQGESATLTLNTAKTGNISITTETVITKDPNYYTASEYARHTGQSLETIYRKANSGKIQGASKFENRWVIPK
jgi:hypothetical protein